MGGSIGGERGEVSGAAANLRIAAISGPGVTRVARKWASIAMMVAAVVTARAVDDTWDYAVRATATVSTNPATITLSWPIDTEANATYSPAYTVYRKTPGADDWGAGVALLAGQTSYADQNITEGVRYEYQITTQYRDPRFPELDHDAYGYVCSGINVPLVEDRGKVILVVEDRVASALSDRVATLRSDLVGDGWTVTQINVDAGDTPSSVRARIQAEYLTGPATALFLLGHIPVVRAGETAPDGHDPRPLPCDAYYGDVDGNWTDANGDGALDNDTIPSDVDLETGRVDFADMDRAGTGLDDLGLTARYLDKDHAYRQAQMRLAPRALIADRIGIDEGRAPAAAGYRAFTAMFGADNVVQASTEDNATNDQRWISVLSRDSYAWTFGSGGGAADAIAELGTGGEYHSLTSADIAADPRAGFYLLFGSFFIDWSQPDDLLRAALASSAGGLGAAWSGRPSFIFHDLAMGETVGYGVRLTQNNDGFYYSPQNAFRRGVHIAWLGDPTLRMNYIAPPSGISGSANGSGLTLAWQASSDAANGGISYLVYHAATADGPFARVTPDPVATTTWTDPAGAADGVYLVRAVKLQQTPSGTYEDASEGAFWTDSTDPVSTGPVASGASGGGGTSSASGSTAGTGRSTASNSVSSTEAPLPTVNDAPSDRPRNATDYGPKPTVAPVLQYIPFDPAP
ncbi:MAG TPA: hypothetical protein VHE61_15465 [Opitutaceae bacterium]|nr:hypothetical protein [Opitutaceae bacterium]